MRIVTIITLMFASVSWAQAQDDYTTVSLDQEPAVDPANLPVTQEYRTTPMTVRKFDEGQWRKVIGDTDYTGESAAKKKKQANDNTDKQPRNTDNSRSQRAWADDDEEASDEGGSTQMSIPWGGPWLTVLFYALIIGLIAAILVMILKNLATGEKVRKPAPAVADTELVVENIEDLDIDSLLRQAGGNYRLAVRLYFLGLLQKLHEKGVIQWKKDKTNREYLMEVYTRAVHYPEVKKLTLAYEQVWYGDHAIEIERYNRLQAAFRTLEQELNTLPESEKR
jgi:hypothetical protein